jgi:hypothetical protein
MHYKCSLCGQIHEDWPAIAFNAPYHYDTLPDMDKENRAEISSDFCIINHGDQTDRFIRAVLFQKINADAEPLNYGVWVSLSEKSFDDYKEHFHDEE